jgi:hypothetical protein
MDTLLIPTWQRPEFLEHCLRNLHNTGDLRTVKIMFLLDHGYSKEVETIIADHQHEFGDHTIVRRPKTGNTITKQSRNLLQGYLTAAEDNDGLVFLVEEDIMVARDFFRYHREVHAQQPDLFCSLSPWNHNRAVTTTEDPEAYYLTTMDYCSWGVAFKASAIREHLAPHVGPAYYSAPSSYCKRTFPNASPCIRGIEQDGLIRRIQDQLCHAAPIAYPHVPRAFHAGYYGYNRRKFIRGTLSQRIEAVGQTIYDPERMREACLTEDFFKDSTPIDLNTPPWQTLKQQQPPEIPA